MREFFDKHYKIIYYILMVAIAIWIAYIKGWIFANFKAVSAKEALELIKNNNVVVVDLRDKEEYKKAHIKGAILIDYKNKNDIKKLEKYKDKEILLYSKTGRVGVDASRALSNEGFRVINVKSGILGLAIEGSKKYPFLFEK